MKKKFLIAAGVIGSLGLAISPIATYAAGVTAGSHVTTSVGDIKVDKDGTEQIHIYASDFDYLADEVNKLIEEKNGTVDTYNDITARLRDVQERINNIN